MFSWYAITAEAEYKRQKFQKDADLQRLLNKIEFVPNRKVPFFCIVMDKLGQWLVKLGMVLRIRYGMTVQ